jgi:molybdopterin/thiamine biosynthesis adenylyltransferase
MAQTTDKAEARKADDSATMVQAKRPWRFKRVELVLPCGMFSEIKDYLFQDTSKEYACYLLCGHAAVGKTLRLLGCYLVKPEPSEYESHSLVSVRLRQELLIEVLKECERHGLSLIDIHSHPFASDSVAFSGVDEADEREKAKWFSKHLPHCFYGSVVLGKHCHKARIRSAAGALIEADLPIMSIEAPLKAKDFAESRSLQIRSIFDRHVRAFGAEGQKRIASAHFGIVGLGGLGASLAISLARLGARKFTLIDPDRVEIHNLNRVAGMTLTDAKCRMRKVDIVTRELLEIEPRINCRTFDQSVLEKRAWRALLATDLIITATDNHASRMLLNALSQQYLVPQVSIGTLIDTKDGKIEGGYGHVGVVLPGHSRPCLLCAKIINPIEAYYETAPESHRREAAKRGYIANFDEPAASVVHLNGVLANLALVEIHNLFCAFKEPACHLQYDMFEQEILNVIEGDQQCATCSPGGGNFGRGDLVSLNNIFKELTPQ